MSDREEFERAFPVPEGIEWISDDQGYRITSDDDYWFEPEGMGHIMAYIGQWTGWQAARESEGGEAVEPRPLSVNRYGVDRDYFTKKLEIIIRDMRNYTPDELARSLGRLAMTADSRTMQEPEFSGTPQPDKWIPCSERLPTEDDGFIWVYSTHTKAVLWRPHTWREINMWTEREKCLWMPANLRKPEPPQPQEGG